MTILVDKLPLPSKAPAQLVCHWLNGNARLVLCSNVHEPPAVPFVAETDSVAPLTRMPMICGDEGGIIATGGEKMASTNTILFAAPPVARKPSVPVARPDMLPMVTPEPPSAVSVVVVTAPPPFVNVTVSELPADRELLTTAQELTGTPVTVFVTADVPLPLEA